MKDTIMQKTPKTFSGIKVKNKESQKRLSGFSKGPSYDYSSSNRIKLAAKIGFSFGLVVLFFLAFYQVSKFYDAHRVIFQTPVIFQKPIIIEDRVPADEPEASPSAMIIETAHFVAQGTPKVEQAYAMENDDLGKLAKFIHFRESTSGKATAGHHIYCRNKGMWNEIGYNPQGKFCFENEEAGFTKLRSWLEERVPKMGTAKALCLYNSGRDLADCEYYQDYLAWKIK